MNIQPKTLLLTTLLVIPMLTGCAMLQHGNKGTNPSRGGNSKPATHAYTPAIGSHERKAIVAAVHQAMEKQEPSRKVALVVPYLKVHNGWAWIQVNPQSPDGKQHYESQSGLLHKLVSGKWKLEEWMPSEEGTDYKKYFKNLKAKYPSAPADIFPK
jgi:hypothetical protein